MKKLELGKNVYQLVIYDPVIALENFKSKNITITSFVKTDQYTYQFKASPLHHHKIMQSFKGVKFVRKEGVLGIIRNLISSRTTIIALIIGILCINYFSSFILRISIKGDAPSLEPLIVKTLEKYNIKPYNYLLDNEKLLEIETEIAKELREQVEFFQIRKRGSLITIRYFKRRVSPIIPVLGENLYAQKDGLVRYFRVSNGQVMVKENQYVRKGDLLVSAYVDKTDGTREYVGTLGSVYANSWHRITASVDEEKVKGLSDAEIHLFLMDKIHEQLSYIINGNDEYIENEKILAYERKNSKIIMIVHYTLLEDITR